MSDSDKRVSILRDIKPYNLEPLTKRVTKSINCDELAVEGAHMDPEKPPVPPIPDPGPQQELDWCVFVYVGIRLIDKSTHGA